MNNTLFIELLALLLLSVFIILKTSLFMLEKRKILFFLPVLIFGVVLTMQVSLIYTGYTQLLPSLQQEAALFVYSFYTYLFFRRMQRGK